MSEKFDGLKDFAQLMALAAFCIAIALLSVAWSVGKTFAAMKFIFGG